MHALAEFLAQLNGQPLGTVVHVNPSDATLVGRYETLGPRRVVLVCPDPEALRGFQRLLPGRPWLEIVEDAVAPQAGPAVWLGYNVPGVSGLLEAGMLQDFFPRLELQLRVRIDAVTLQTVLERLNVAASERANLLVLEAPGGDAPALETLRPETLSLFEWLLLRGAATAGLYKNGVAADAARQRLAEQHFRTIRTTDADEPLWPTTLLQLDRAAAQRATLTARVTALEALLDTAKTEHEAEVRGLQAQRSTLEQALSAQEQIAKERQTRLDGEVRLRTERDAQAASAELRQRMLEEELFRAEAQIELVKDLLLREAGL